MNSLKVLKFQVGNAKLIAIQDSDTDEVIVIPVHTISLPSGYSCPAADECLSKANKVTGKITDGLVQWIAVDGMQPDQADRDFTNDVLKKLKGAA